MYPLANKQKFTTIKGTIKAMKRFAFYFMILLSCIQSCTAGFIAGTLVKTPNGHIPIEQLEVNDLIICYDYQNSFTTRSISHIKKQTTTAYLCIVCESKPLYTSSDHLFYLPQQNIWVPAHLLKSIAGVGVAISLKKGKNHLPKTTINIISSESCNNA